jgi:hypothetical protein
MNITAITDLLTRAKNRITNGWCQNAAALDERGEPCDAWDPRAKSWDMNGSIIAEKPQSGVLPEDWFNLQGLAKDALRKAADNNPLVWFNDAVGRSREEVVSVFDRAIKMAEVMTQPPENPKSWWERIVEWVKGLSIKSLCK